MTLRIETVPLLGRSRWRRPGSCAGRCPSPAPEPMTPPVLTPPGQSRGVFQALPPSWLVVESSTTLMLPVSTGPLVWTSASVTPCQAVAAFWTSQTLSVPHLGSSLRRFVCVPVTLSTASGEAPVSQNQRKRHGVPEQSPGSRPPMFAHFECAVPAASSPVEGMRVGDLRAPPRRGRPRAGTRGTTRHRARGGRPTREPAWRRPGRRRW